MQWQHVLLNSSVTIQLGWKHLKQVRQAWEGRSMIVPWQITHLSWNLLNTSFLANHSKWIQSCFSQLHLFSSSTMHFLSIIAILLFMKSITYIWNVLVYSSTYILLRFWDFCIFRWREWEHTYSDKLGYSLIGYFI